MNKAAVDGRIFVHIGTIEFAPAQRANFVGGPLRRRWHRQYPELFDSQDLTQANNQPNYHFYEWLAAIVLHQATGYHSLVGKYQFDNHPRKRTVATKILESALHEILNSRTKWGRTQGPDLLMYAPDYSDWFFCEAKGPRDHLGDRQQGLFSVLAQASGKPIRLLEFRRLRRPKTMAGDEVPNRPLQPGAGRPAAGERRVGSLASQYQ